MEHMEQIYSPGKTGEDIEVNKSDFLSFCKTLTRVLVRGYTLAVKAGKDTT